MDSDNYTTKHFTEHGTRRRARPRRGLLCICLCVTPPRYWTQPREAVWCVCVYVERPAVSDGKPRLRCLFWQSLVDHGQQREKKLNGALCRPSLCVCVSVCVPTKAGKRPPMCARACVCVCPVANTVGHVLALHDDSLCRTDPQLNPAALSSSGSPDLEQPVRQATAYY